MAQFNENIKIVAPNPIDDRYKSLRTSAGAQLPYSGTSEVLGATGIPTAQRYIGQTVLVQTGATSPVEYWFQNNITTLVEKKYASEQLVGDFITGATNLGYFSGKTGIQIIDLAFGFSPYGGSYVSEYNNYFLDTTNTIRLGPVTHNGINRRGYVHALGTYSWIFSKTTGTWVVINGDASENVDASTGAPLFTSLYTQAVWTPPSAPPSGATGINVIGVLTTGSTLTIGSPIFAYKENQDLHLRTIKSNTPEFLTINYDGNFINFSGVSSVVTGANVGTGVGKVFKQKTGTTLQFRTIEGTGDTAVYQVGDRILISATGSITGTTAGANVGTGVDVFKSKTGTTLQFRRITGSGGTTVTQSGDSVIVNAGKYNLASPSAIPVGGICAGTALTGKTSFQLWEELLVPELCGTVTEPSVSSVGLSVSGLREIDENISQTVTINFSRGLINPQYCSITPYRSTGANAYCFCGSDMPSGFQACTALSASAIDASYDILIGAQTWGGCARRNAGNAALSSKGNEYCAALTSGYTNVGSNSIVGVYPLWATCSTIGTLSKISPLYAMDTSSYVQVTLATESGGNKQKFEIPCAWIGVPTNNPLTGVRTYVSVANAWCYLNGATAACSLTEWNATPASETVQGNSVGYCQYTFNGIDRATTCIRLEF